MLEPWYQESLAKAAGDGEGPGCGDGEALERDLPHSTPGVRARRSLINTPMIDEQPVTEEVVYKMLFRATTGWGLGLKGMLLTFPLILWVFGGPFLVLGMLGLVAVQSVLDFGEFGSVDAMHASGEAHAVEEGQEQELGSRPPRSTGSHGFTSIL